MNIVLKSLHTFFGHFASSKRSFALERLDYADVTGLLQFVELNAQVACGGFGFFLEEGKIRFLQTNEQRHNCQPKLGVQQRV